MDDGLSRDQAAVIEAGKLSLGRTIQGLCGDDSRMALHLAIVASAGLFADIITSSSTAGASALCDVVNQQLEASGWRLIPTPRN
jgi:hypothetical protein